MKKITPIISLFFLPCWGVAIILGDDNDTCRSHDKIVEASRFFFATKTPNVNNLISPWSKNTIINSYAFTNNTATKPDYYKSNLDICSTSVDYNKIDNNKLKLLNFTEDISSNKKDTLPLEVFSLKPQLSCDTCFTTDFSHNYKLGSTLEFKGFWEKNFTLIGNSEFTLSTGEQITTPFMSVNIDNCISYTCSLTGWTIIRIPYENLYVMDIIIPNETSITPINEIQCRTIFNLLSSLSSKTRNKDIKISRKKISMPLFKFTQETFFAYKSRLCVQQCSITVDEKGIKHELSSNQASSHSASNFVHPYNNYVINSPFFFAISKLKNHKNKTLIEDIILLGKLENPSIER
jgi:hypothetical protein